MKEIFRELFEEIKHGDQEHQTWLKNKLDDFSHKRIISWCSIQVEIDKNTDKIKVIQEENTEYTKVFTENNSIINKIENILK